MTMGELRAGEGGYIKQGRFRTEGRGFFVPLCKGIVFMANKLISYWLRQQYRAHTEYGIFGEGSHILTNQKRDNCAFSLLIDRNMRPFPENTVLYWSLIIRSHTLIS